MAFETGCICAVFFCPANSTFRVFDKSKTNLQYFLWGQNYFGNPIIVVHDDYWELVLASRSLLCENREGVEPILHNMVRWCNVGSIVQYTSALMIGKKIGIFKRSELFSDDYSDF